MAGPRVTLVFALIVTFFAAYTFLVSKFTDIERDIRQKHKQHLEVPKFQHMLGPNWDLATSKCAIPHLDPWHKSIYNFVQYSPPLDCNKVLEEDKSNLTASLTRVLDNKIHLTERGRAIKLQAKDCCYTSIKRGTDDNAELLEDGGCVTFDELDGYEPAHELIRITCKQYNYTNIHSFFKIDLCEKAAFDMVAEEKLDKDGYYNVLMVGMDTVSRLNGRRQLTQTLKVMKEHFDIIEFKGYNKVGENTFPNLIPLLTGLTPEQLLETRCWSSGYTEETESGEGYMDNCKFLWNFYQDFGYSTYYSEDWAFASTFNYLKEGFRSRPTTFYGRPFVLARESLLLPKDSLACKSCFLDRPTIEADLENLKNFITINRQSPYFAFFWVNCPQHDDLNGASQVDPIIEKFFLDIKHLTKYDRTFVFLFSDHGFRWNDFVSTRIGHYESSLPLLTLAAPKLFIEKHKQLYQNLKSHENSLLTPFDLFKTLIELRNLGKRADKPRTNKSLTKSQLPPECREVGSTVATKTGTSKVQRRVYDIEPEGTLTYSEIKRVWPIYGTNYKQQFMINSMFERHNSSLHDRSCSEAGIPDNYCVCHEFEPVEMNEPVAYGAALYLVYIHMHDKLAGHEECAKLEMKELVAAGQYNYRVSNPIRNKDIPPKSLYDGSRLTTTASPSIGNARFQPFDPSSMLSAIPDKEFSIQVKTQPGDGLFQETVRYYGGRTRGYKNCKRLVSKLVGNLSSLSYSDKHNAMKDLNLVCKYDVRSLSISRLNLYGEQSKCITNNIELKKVCFCETGTTEERPA